jgi:hypothetical protein
MSFHLKRFVFFFCILNIGWGCCFGNRANAQDPEIIYRLFLSSVFYQHDPLKIIGRVFLLTDYTIGVPDVVIYSAEPFPGEEGIGPETQYVPVAVTDGKGNYVFTPEDRWYHLIPRKNGYQFTPEASIGRGHNFMWPNFAAYWSREIGGRVTYSDGSGFADVGIYHNTTQVAVTDSQGYYKASLPPSEYTLIPQKSGYLFTPPSLPVPADQSNHGNLDFTAQTAVTISGNVTWKNSSSDMNIWSNPLSMVAVEAHAEDGSLSSRGVTGVDGKYSLSVPRGWTGWVKPFKDGFEFWVPTGPGDPISDRCNFTNIYWDSFRDFYAPSGLVYYPITVLVTGPLHPGDESLFYADARGIEHANGFHFRWGFYGSDSGTTMQLGPGWIGEITPINDRYTFTPASIRLDKILTSDMTFSFTRTKK